ncbi:MAG: MFS transporter, partial [Gammaproteobacteria bacterium]|nr:MFS transporter [Gammaproteobacteria bacterium]
MSIPTNPAIPKVIVVLGLVSLFMDISSEMIHALLPVFMVTVLGSSATTVGIIEGLGEGLALIVRVFSGALSDWLARRKRLILIGYLLGTLSKPLFAIATASGMVMFARSIDRIGKGIRGAPRDALIADISPKEMRGAAYGLRQSLDSLGALLGPLLAIVLMALTMNDYRQVFLYAVIPGSISLLLIIFFVKEPVLQAAAAHLPLKRDETHALPSVYWWVLGIGICFTLARFSEAFMILRGE